MKPWACFWIFLAVFLVCDASLVSRGMDGAIWHFKTPAELELQKHLIERAAAKKGTP